MSDYPGSVDSFSTGGDNDPLNNPSLPAWAQKISNAVIALQQKLGTGSATPPSGARILFTANGSTQTTWATHGDANVATSTALDSHTNSSTAHQSAIDTRINNFTQTGTYTGNGSSNRSISLPFSPRYVLITTDTMINDEWVRAESGVNQQAASTQIGINFSGSVSDPTIVASTSRALRPELGISYFTIDVGPGIIGAGHLNVNGVLYRYYATR